jgi:hypothetical protein
MAGKLTRTIELTTNVAIITIAVLLTIVPCARELLSDGARGYRSVEEGI